MYSAKTDIKPLNRSQRSLVPLVCLVSLSPPAPFYLKFQLIWKTLSNLETLSNVIDPNHVLYLKKTRARRKTKVELPSLLQHHCTSQHRLRHHHHRPVHQQRQQSPLQVKHQPTKGEGAQGVRDKQGPGAWQWTWLMAETLDKYRDWMYGGGALGNCNTEASSGWSGY